MARITSIGMPRKTFVSSTAEEARQPSPGAKAGPSSAAAEKGDDKPKKKVHRSGKRLKAKRERAKAIESGEMEAPVPTPPSAEGKEGKGKRKRERERERDTGETGAGYVREGEKRGWGRDEGIAQKTRYAEDKAEQRRLQRIDEKKSALTCFGCRQTGHTARDCPKKGGVTGNICYRCNSTAHSLSQCYKPINPADPTPYATCFICNAQGHLSSQCPTNDKGVYVHGGKCNVCGSVRHLIKDCPTLKERREAEKEKEEEARYTEARTMGGAGADEDDFMVEARVRMKEMGEKEKNKGKKEKKPFNNNGLREPYKKAEVDEGPVSGESSAAVTPVVAVAKPKAKAKVVAF